MEGDLTWAGEPTVHYTDNVLQNGIPENYIVILINTIPIN